MPYKLSDFDDLAIEKTVSPSADVDFSGGMVIRDLPQNLKKLLSTVGGESHEGDFSRQDASILTTMLSNGLSPQDCYSTFAASARGKHAEERKNGHFDDYLSRSIRKAVGFLSKGKSNRNDIEVDFSKRRPDDSVHESGIISTTASTVTVETTRWIWDKYVPAGKITIIAGDPGLGKSTLALDFVSRISRGAVMPTGERSVSGTCIIASAEDAAADTIVPRLIAAKANLKRIEIIREVQIGQEVCYLSLPRDLDRLRNLIVDKGARVLVVDPLNAFIDKSTNTHKDQDIRLVLGPLENIAEQTGCAVVVIAHLNKSEDSGALYRVGGSIGFVGAARSVLQVKPIEESEDCALFSLKSNLAKKPAALRYETTDVRIEKVNANDWCGERSVSTSVIRWKGETPDPNRSWDLPQKKKECLDFLKQELADGEVESSIVREHRKDAGVSQRTLDAHKSEFGVTSVKRGEKWYMKPPSQWSE